MWERQTAWNCTVSKKIYKQNHNHSTFVFNCAGTPENNADDKMDVSNGKTRQNAKNCGI